MSEHDKHDEHDVERALRLLEQIEAWHALEDGLIDPVDWDRFDCGALLDVADGQYSLNDIVWGRVPDEEEMARQEREKLRSWQKATGKVS